MRTPFFSSFRYSRGPKGGGSCGHFDTEVWSSRDRFRLEAAAVWGLGVGSEELWTSSGR